MRGGIFDWGPCGSTSGEMKDGQIFWNFYALLRSKCNGGKTGKAKGRLENGGKNRTLGTCQRKVRDTMQIQSSHPEGNTTERDHTELRFCPSVGKYISQMARCMRKKSCGQTWNSKSHGPLNVFAPFSEARETGQQKWSSTRLRGKHGRRRMEVGLVTTDMHVSTDWMLPHGGGKTIMEFAM